MKRNTKKWKRTLMISTPTLGLVRYEWYQARVGQVIPMNWESSGYDVFFKDNSLVLPFSPLGYGIDDAYNLIVNRAMQQKVEWLLIIEDDVIVPNNLFVKINDYMEKGDIPVVSGLYYLKGVPTQPLVFRGRGNGSYSDFKIGKKVWCDGVPMGCLLIHTSILKYFHDKEPEYKVSTGEIVKKVFETPRRQFYDPQAQGWFTHMGTQDLYFCDRVIEQKVLKKTGWEKIGRKRYPFLVDTTIFCKHIDRTTGRQYP